MEGSLVFSRWGGTMRRGSRKGIIHCCERLVARPGRIVQDIMKFFKALIEGKNCWVNFDGATRRLGFFTTRVTRGLNLTQAEEVIRRNLEAELSSLLLNVQDDPPEIIVGQLMEIDAEAARNIPNAGYTWYPEDISCQN